MAFKKIKVRLPKGADYSLREEIARLYRDEKLSTVAIGERLGRAPQTIIYHLKMAGEARRSSSAVQGGSKERDAQFKAAFLTHGRNQTAAAHALKIPVATAKYMARRLGLRTRSRAEARRAYFGITDARDSLIRKLRLRGLGAIAIARTLGLSKAGVRGALRRLGMPTDARGAPRAARGESAFGRGLESFADGQKSPASECPAPKRRESGKPGEGVDFPRPPPQRDSYV